MIPSSHFDRFHAKKYRSANPLKRHLISNFAETVDRLLGPGPHAGTLVEVGVGEGFLSGYLSERHPALRFLGVDLCEPYVLRCRELFPRVEARVGNAYSLRPAFPELAGGPPDFLLCAELLEHLEDPHVALSQMAELAPRRLVLSVPHEPWFSLANLATGNNLGRWGTDPEHVQRWTRRAFVDLISTFFTVEEVATPFPWTAVAARPK